MSLTDAEFASILEDEEKCIRNDISWAEDEDHSPTREFRADVESHSGWPLFVKSPYDRYAGT